LEKPAIVNHHKMALGRKKYKKKLCKDMKQNGRRKVLKIPIHAESTCSSLLKNSSFYITSDGSPSTTEKTGMLFV
jgi:hypothetical protein